MKATLLAIAIRQRGIAIDLMKEPGKLVKKMKQAREANCKDIVIVREEEYTLVSNGYMDTNVVDEEEIIGYFEWLADRYGIKPEPGNHFFVEKPTT